jgi:hypothetical protein
LNYICHIAQSEDNYPRDQPGYVRQSKYGYKGC